jgi:23S rRNA (pseudouridine1915-N3)-methyltransferase
MKITLGSIATRRAGAGEPAEALAQEYLSRLKRICPADLVTFASEAALLESAARAPGRPGATLVLFDSRGELASSEQFAAYLGRLRDDSTGRVLFGIGPADGWSAAALGSAARTFSFGRITLPHLLARAVAAEQIYRAFTILAGHPYHSGH